VCERPAYQAKKEQKQPYVHHSVVV
jgi:hypothetical protein